MVDRCYATAGLLDALLALAADREPEAVSTLLVVTPAGALDAPADRPAPPAPDVDSARSGPDVEPTRSAPDLQPTTSVDALDPETPVFTDFYLPSDGRSVDAVFGVDVSVPHGQAQGRFVSHPLGELSVGTRDDLHEVVLVAVPPWTRDDVAAFDRGGARLDLRLVDAAPPERPFDG